MPEAMDDPNSPSATEDYYTPCAEGLAGIALVLHPTNFWALAQFIRCLGMGGFGVVFAALDEELDRLVAIKVPRPERVSQPKDIEAYLSEARILARLDHPHIRAGF